MKANLELAIAPLIFLYNLLVPEVQKFMDNAPLPPELATLLAQVNDGLETLTGEAAWFACGAENCDHRPFRLTASEIGDAEGVISCEYCGKLCRRVPEEKLQRSLL